MPGFAARHLPFWWSQPEFCSARAQGIQGQCEPKDRGHDADLTLESGKSLRHSDYLAGLYGFIGVLATGLVTILAGAIISAAGYVSMQIHPGPVKKLGCYKCGRPVDEADRFCRSCGADIEEGTLKASISSGSPSPSLDS